LFNRAVASYNLGSIFKIIDLACAYSKNINPSMYYFARDMLFGRQRFRCSAYGKGGHGLIDLHEAFASSCNPYFIELGIKIGPNNIIETANKFGFGKLPVLTPKALKNQPEIFQKPGVLLTETQPIFP